ncbi:Uncharacterised protein [Bordetella trematum]|uniref:hypothetical protein n=1 Tax=Bordetella trematum TaxID=123899 RepID=UPI0007945DDA|nr:hypothetical protein [Bordetella trematum]SAI51526.1 Uncharacterised protein [Bordetella trematum]
MTSTPSSQAIASLDSEPKVALSHALGDMALNAAHIALFAMRQKNPEETLGVMDDVADSVLQYLVKELGWPADMKADAKARMTQTLQMALAVSKGAKR